MSFVTIAGWTLIGLGILGSAVLAAKMYRVPSGGPESERKPGMTLIVTSVVTFGVGVFLVLTGAWLGGHRLI